MLFLRWPLLSLPPFFPLTEDTSRLVAHDVVVDNLALLFSIQPHKGNFCVTLSMLGANLQQSFHWR
jgi:hypothetical protein